MIVSYMQGGLGNQMFQYAFGHAQSVRHRTRLWLDTSSYESDKLRSFNLGLLKDVHIVQCPGGYKEPFGTTFHERSLRYDPDLEFSIRNFDSLVGYWQSEKYFINVANQIRFMYTQPIEMTEYEQGFFARIVEAGNKSVALGIRRSDYLEKLDYHGVLDMDYYLEALKLLRKKHGSELKVFVFSDDPVWCLNNLPFVADIYYNVPTVGKRLGREAADLALMSQCRNAIIANSTFHWWGAYLSEGFGNKTIIAPSRWFSNNTLDSSDIVPERWIRI